MNRASTRKVRLRVSGFLTLALFVMPAAHAACVGQQSGDLADLEERAFRDPAKALPELANTLSSAADMPATRRAALHAIAADAARQLGFSRQSITHADAGLALLPAGDMSDLAVRMRTVRALVSTNVGGIDAAAVELTRVIDAIRDRPLALGCVLRDRGWLNFRDGNPDQALDDLLRAYALLRRNASREEAMVAAGRLSMAQFSVRDYPQALSLVDETVAFFREEKAPVRLATALDRRAAILKAAGRLDEALIAATEALRIHEGIGDRVGTGLSQMRMCGVEIERNALKEASRWCDRAELTLSQTSGMDDNDYRTLAALRGRLFLALGRSKDAVGQFDRAIAPGGAQPADDIAELYELRSRAHAAVGNYSAAFSDQGEFLRRMREQGTLDRIREVAQLRVQFENDQEKQKIVLLEKDKKLAEERLNSQTRTTQLVAIAGLAGLITAFFLGYALLSHRRHRAELIRLAERDELTGLLNRRAIVRKAVEFLSRARESKGTLIIGLVDLDHFKSINDRFGHAVGDQLLQRFAAALRTSLHSREVFGRYGGEEFLVLFPDTTLDQARQAAERLRISLREQRLRVDEQDVTVTLSLGLASYETGDVLFDQVARRADIALYVAKTQGRDRCEIFNPARHGAVAITAGVNRQR
ncbi:MAG TPA: GGDEF domain-containing protein [Steroidobacteraceae bacterium]|nr:GGDEF domain-containing protein [Steroidobacteraceae bacterium]